MRIAVRRFQDADAPAVERLNRRLELGQCPHRLYKEDLSGNPHADLEIRPINDSLFVAVDGDEIRGGSWLREQHFWVDGAQHRVGWMKYPVAESLVNSAYAGVPGSMVLQLLRTQPHLMAMGMGGHHAPFARLLAGIRWKSSTVPFFFRVTRPYRVLRELAYARRRWWLRVAMDLAAVTGLGWTANRAVRATAYRGDPQVRSVTVEASFTPWADPIWEACKGAYQAVATRDAKALDFTYPPSFQDLFRLRIARSGRDIGWICAQILPRTPDVTAYFGNLRVGILTDAFSLPADAPELLAAGAEHLEAQRVDLVVAYFSHRAWARAARRLRFIEGPSNLAFYRSPRADQLVVDGGSVAQRCHITRSDCDGPKRA